MFILFQFGLGCCMAILWEKAAHSVDHIFSLFLTILRIILVISRFGFVGWIWVLIASVSGLCLVFTFFLSDAESRK